MPREGEERSPCLTLSPPAFVNDVSSPSHPLYDTNVRSTLDTRPVFVRVPISAPSGAEASSARPLLPPTRTQYERRSGSRLLVSPQQSPPRRCVMSPLPHRLVYDNDGNGKSRIAWRGHTPPTPNEEEAKEMEETSTKLKGRGEEKRKRRTAKSVIAHATPHPNLCGMYTQTAKHHLYDKESNNHMPYITATLHSDDEQRGRPITGGVHPPPREYHPPQSVAVEVDDNPPSYGMVRSHAGSAMEFLSPGSLPFSLPREDPTADSLSASDSSSSASPLFQLPRRVVVGPRRRVSLQHPIASLLPAEEGWTSSEGESDASRSASPHRPLVPSRETLLRSFHALQLRKEAAVLMEFEAKGRRGVVERYLTETRALLVEHAFRRAMLRASPISANNTNSYGAKSSNPRSGRGSKRLSPPSIPPPQQQQRQQKQQQQHQERRQHPTEGKGHPRGGYISCSQSPGTETGTLTSPSYGSHGVADVLRGAEMGLMCLLSAELMARQRLSDRAADEWHFFHRYGRLMEAALRPTTLFLQEASQRQTIAMSAAVALRRFQSGPIIPQRKQKQQHHGHPYAEEGPLQKHGSSPPYGEPLSCQEQTEGRDRAVVGEELSAIAASEARSSTNESIGMMQHMDPTPSTAHTVTTSMPQLAPTVAEDTPRKKRKGKNVKQQEHGGQAHPKGLQVEMRIEEQEGRSGLQSWTANTTTVTTSTGGAAERVFFEWDPTSNTVPRTTNTTGITTGGGNGSGAMPSSSLLSQESALRDNAKPSRFASPSPRLGQKDAKLKGNNTYSQTHTIAQRETPLRHRKQNQSIKGNSDPAWWSNRHVVPCSLKPASAATAAAVLVAQTPWQSMARQCTPPTQRPYNDDVIFDRAPPRRHNHEDMGDEMKNTLKQENVDSKKKKSEGNKKQTKGWDAQVPSGPPSAPSVSPSATSAGSSQQHEPFEETGSDDFESVEEVEVIHDKDDEEEEEDEEDDDWSRTAQTDQQELHDDMVSTEEDSADETTQQQQQQHYEIKEKDNYDEEEEEEEEGNYKSEERASSPSEFDQTAITPERPTVPDFSLSPMRDATAACSDEDDNCRFSPAHRVPQSHLRAPLPGGSVARPIRQQTHRYMRPTMSWRRQHEALEWIPSPRRHSISPPPSSASHALGVTRSVRRRRGDVHRAPFEEGPGVWNDAEVPRRPFAFDPLGDRAYAATCDAKAGNETTHTADVTQRNATIRSVRRARQAAWRFMADGCATPPRRSVSPNEMEMEVAALRGFVTDCHCAVPSTISPKRARPNANPMHSHSTKARSNNPTTTGRSTTPSYVEAFVKLGPEAAERRRFLTALRDGEALRDASPRGVTPLRANRINSASRRSESKRGNRSGTPQRTFKTMHTSLTHQISGGSWSPQPKPWR